MTKSIKYISKNTCFINHKYESIGLRAYTNTRSVSIEFHCLELLIKYLRKCFEDSLKWKSERIWCFHSQFGELFWKFGVANEVQNNVKPLNTNSLTSKRNFLANDVCDLESLLVKTSWILRYISRIFQRHSSRINEGTLESVENLSLYYHHPFKETMFQTLDLLDLLFELKKNSYSVEMLVDKLDALFAYSLLNLECLGNFHSIIPFNASSISNVAYLLWLFEEMDWRTNPFKGGADGMIGDAQDIIELLQGPVMRAKAKRMEEEH
ncbi:hypothetical protein M9H77_23283 [Catharanthus roseus]|uniref:Uncharacterized protein n=1 Tax=Catharanthus roseus TaxID=4058 RepID=A0ACC0AUE2_CATRO|nr:hypothetical protein M9H77_23283 [Catharanthus roseus]